MLRRLFLQLGCCIIHHGIQGQVPTLAPVKLSLQDEPGVRGVGLIDLLVLRAIKESGMNLRSDTVTGNTE